MEFTEEQVRRYARHILLPQVGGRGQAKLLASSVLVSGLGGVGWWSSLYLAAAGVGHLATWEPEGEGAKELPPLFLPAEGASWGEAFRRQLGALNPDVEVTTSQGGQPGPLIEGCALALLGVWDEARAELAEAFWRVGKPALAGEAKGWRGWAAVALPGGPCPRCLAARGVEFLPPGTAPGPEPCAVTVGSLLALEAMKVLLDIGESRRGSLYRLDLWDLRLERGEPPGEAGCSSCGAGTGGGAERPTPKKETS